MLLRHDLLLVLVLSSWEASRAFTPSFARTSSCSTTILRGKLDDLTRDLYAPDSGNTRESIEKDSFEATKLDKEKVDRYGAGDWKDFVDFDEFDGGDGQMGVAGDGNKKLEKFGKDVQLSMAKSKVMSAKNAWGRTTGYAESLIDKGMEATRAQQMENWRNQQEVIQQRKNHRYMTDEFDKVDETEQDWRSLAKFGVKRNQDFDFDEAFGEVVPDVDNLEGTLEFRRARINGGFVIQEIDLKNSFMGFSDFRAAFSPDTPKDFVVTPNEGALGSNDPIHFVVKYKASTPGTVEGYLVIQTEAMKKTWKLVGSTS